MARPKSAVIGAPCALDDCTTPVPRNSAKGLCKKHYNRLYRHGDPSVVLPFRRSITPKGADSPRWAGDEVGYSAVHVRLATERGPAMEHSCRHCGETAAHWAFDHGGRPQIGAMEYSTNLDDYIPLCRSCHKRFDTMRSE